MFKTLVPFILLALLSCGGNTAVDDDPDNGSIPQDSIIEYDIDEDRVSAVEFNNELTLMQEDMLRMMETLFTSDTGEVDINYENAVFEAQINLDELKEKEFDGSEKEYIAKMKKLMNFYLDELNNGFRDILPLLRKADLNEAELKQLEEYDRNFVAKEKELFMEVFAAQDAFAEKNNISLQEQ
ncbi:MAG: hypothetical protein HUJ25_17340 [Crocinitomicaceae bacterium]|nr:hypothetical protein [Crocinitomicaceae bacterium]